MQKHKILSERLVLNTPIMTLLDYEVLHPVSKEKKTYSVSHFDDWVNVIAETDDHQLVLVEQWRAGTNSMSIELPGGKIDKKDGSTDTPADIVQRALTAGLRELKEETGYAPSEHSKVMYIGSVEANPAIQNNRMHYVFVNHAQKVGETDFDEFELVYTHIIEKHRVQEMVKEGRIVHAYAVIGLLKTLGP